MNRLGWLYGCAGLLMAGAFGNAWAETSAAPVSFNRDVRPILSDKCFRCHGPDAAQRKAELRLDDRNDALADRDGRPAIVAGNPDESEIYARIVSDDPDDRMPPHDSGSVLSKREIDTVKRWIEQGAEYQPHWAFLAPRAARVPVVRQASWPRNPVDFFVLGELEAKGRKPSPEAPRATLLRRVTLDLTGLPPTPEAMAAFLADPSPDAYERAVDRLLQSPGFGERMALDWLDAARYADTIGYYLDIERHAWPWRDWVIRAFNANMPFDRFTIEQLAGDLLPSPTLDTKVATGFNRNHMVTNESGSIDEEFRVSYVVDRVDTTSTVWLGMTVACARCHDHKYDPISQEEYYRLFACFNNVPEKGLIHGPADPSPLISLPTTEQEQQLALLAARRSQREASMKKATPALTRAMDLWEATAESALPGEPKPPSLVHFDLNKDGEDRGPRKVAATAVGNLKFEPGVNGPAAAFDATQYVEFDDAVKLDRSTPFSLATWIKMGNASTGCVVSKMTSTADARGFEVMWYKAQPRINLVNEWGRSAIEVVAKRTFSSQEWHHLVVTYDGSGRASGVTVFVDGVSQSLVVRRDTLNGPIATDEPWRIAWKGTGIGFEGSLDEFRLYARPLRPDEAEALYSRDVIQGGIATPKAKRTRQQTAWLRTYYISHFASQELRSLDRELTEVRDEEEAVRKTILTSLVMEDMNQPRDAHILKRGQYDQPGKKVEPGVPAILGTLAADAPRNRLGLARWLVDPANPLTARVAVNRYWQLVFGDGLVRTVNDFGLQGEAPSNPDLLDWLAVNFVRDGWDVKALVRMLVTSATYRQSSDFTPDLLAADPDNRWLARGPRYRLSAELIRDQALAAGGLLVDRLGGPSVKPYQPPGIWEAVSYNGDQSYVPDVGAARYRRSLYTFWKRQAPPPSILTFDGPTRETCTVRRPRTNTPLQSLVLLNDLTYVEAARALATRVLHDGRSDTDRIRLAFERVTGRVPDQAEVAALGRFYHDQLAAFRDRPQDAQALAQPDRDAPVDPSVDISELAAWTATASILLNLDETITQH